MDYLSDQILTYLGNKRALLGFIGEGLAIAKEQLGRDKISFCDIFSGSGIVARYAKSHSNFIIANDLEEYSRVSNLCYLTPETPALRAQICKYHKRLLRAIRTPREGFVAELYAPRDDSAIQKGERAFYTRANAQYIDTARQAIDELVPEALRVFFIAPLLHSASVHANTSGVFKGFHKDKFGIGHFGGRGENALARICQPITLEMPILSPLDVPFIVTQRDANALARDIGHIDVCYLDPPYNQHPYGSNYFMLNLIARYERPCDISAVSGIPTDWHRSDYNSAVRASEAFFDLCGALKARFLLISYNDEGFIKFGEFKRGLAKLGRVTALQKRYNTYRGSRNLRARATHVKEFLFVVEKK